MATITNKAEGPRFVHLRAGRSDEDGFTTVVLRPGESVEGELHGAGCAVYAAQQDAGEIDFGGALEAVVPEGADGRGGESQGGEGQGADGTSRRGRRASATE